MKRATRIAAAAVVAVVCFATSAEAHDGPPYPIVVDEQLAGHVVSIWADPDVGVGTFYVYIDAETEPAKDVQLQVGVEPADAHLVETYFAAQASEEGEPFQLIAEVDFDRRGMWDVRFVFDGDAGADELRLPVNVTPPGLGTFDIAWYLSPFAAIAFLWIKVVLKKREIAREAPSC